MGTQGSHVTVFSLVYRRRTLQLHLCPTQGYAWLWPECLPVLAGTDAWGRRGPTLRGQETCEVCQRRHWWVEESLWGLWELVYMLLLDQECHGIMQSRQKRKDLSWAQWSVSSWACALTVFRELLFLFLIWESSFKIFQNIQMQDDFRLAL